MSHRPSTRRRLRRRGGTSNVCSRVVRHRSAIATLSMGLTLLAVGCQQPIQRIALPPLPMARAAQLVNANIDKITGTLRATGTVDGYFTRSDGRRQSYHLDGVLFYLAPSYVRFDLKTLGQRQFLFGSNNRFYWYYDRSDGRYHCRRQGEPEPMAAEIPVDPDRIADAFGLTPIPTDATQSGRVRQVPRVEDDYQQILFLVADEHGVPTLEKEYWLDRRWPRLVRRVVYRDIDGVVTMGATLDDYAPVSPGGPLLPRTMTADWPDTRSHMRFRVSMWTQYDNIGPDGIQFRTPRDCVDR